MDFFKELGEWFEEGWDDLYGRVMEGETPDEKAIRIANRSNQEIMRETYPELNLPEEPTDLTQISGKSIYKEIHFESSSKESMFAKWINWLTQNGVASISREGEPLGTSIGMGGTQMLDSDGKPRTQLEDLRNVDTQQKVFDYFQANWAQIPKLRERIRNKLQTQFERLKGYNFTEESVWSELYPDDTPVTDANLLGDLLSVFGDVGNADINLRNMNSKWGVDALQYFVGDLFREALVEEIQDISKTNRAVLFGPNTATVGVTLDPDAEQQPEILWVTSFDGTIFGDIESVKDVFSGGRIGPMDAWYQMQQLYERTRNVHGYSPTIERIQQELYAYGYMNAPAEWGKLDIVNLQGNADVTIDAMQMLMSDITNEGLRIANDDPASLSPDGTAYIDTVMNRSMARKLETLPKRLNTQSGQVSNLIEQVIGNLETLATRSGKTFTDAGKLRLREQLKKSIAGADADEVEEAFGGGGTLQEQQIAEYALRNFYQDDNWDSNVYIGANNSGVDFSRYAQRSGALSAEELKLIDDDWVNYKPMYGEGDVDTRDVARDMIVSHFLDLMVSEGEEPADLTKALSTFGHTMGARIGADFGYTMSDYESMAEKIKRDLALAPEPDQSRLVGTLSDRMAKANNLGGNGVALNALLGAMQNRRSLSDFSTQRNV
tara:strand:+ start:9270 stop:11258 length:1989 start_codon:yes stop_codon:yes gene_type:complete